MPRSIEFAFLDSHVTARAVLLDDDAPRTCQAVWDCLPVSGDALHAMYSGTVAALFLTDSRIGAEVGEENATTNIQTGDVMFTHYDAGKRHGHPEALSEIYWAYDRYVWPTIPGQHIPAIANVFARILDDASAFYDMSRRTHSEGFKRLQIHRVEALVGS